MTSNKPYLVRAINQWCMDHDFTTYLLVNSEEQGVSVPPESIEDGKVVLNISEEATRELEISNTQVHFLANFNQRVVKVVVPVDAIIAVYAHETGEGITFSDEEDGDSAYSDIDLDIGASDNDEVIHKTSKKPVLTIIK